MGTGGLARLPGVVDVRPPAGGPLLPDRSGVGCDSLMMYLLKT